MKIVVFTASPKPGEPEQPHIIPAKIAKKYKLKPRQVVSVKFMEFLAENEQL